MLAKLFKYDVIRRPSHGYCSMGLMGNAMEIGHFPWDSHRNPVPMKKPDNKQFIYLGDNTKRTVLMHLAKGP